MFLHEAQYLEPVMRDIEAMLASSQRNVTGTVELILRPYSYTLVGVDSTYDLMKTDSANTARSTRPGRPTT